MFTPLLIAAVVATAPTPTTAPVPTEFWQIYPDPLPGHHALRRSKPGAVVLIHGLMIHPLNGDKAKRPNPHPWQHPTGTLARTLSEQFDVFGFSYAQTRAIDEPGFLDGLGLGVAVLKAAGYREIVLVGHSAGGLIARQFVEQNPKSGVTKVLTIAAPHRGSALARIPFGVPPVQWPFIRSLSPSVREQVCDSCPAIADRVQFCCVVCKLSNWSGDTVVSAESQWPEDLQAQGIPAVHVPVGHMEAVKDEQSVKAIATLAKGRVIRWDAETVQQARTVLFGE